MRIPVIFALLIAGIGNVHAQTRRVDTALLRAALSAGGPQGYQYQMVHQYQGKNLDTSQGRMYTDAAHHFHYAESGSEVFIISEQGTAMINHRKQSIRFYRFKDSADWRPYAMYFTDGQTVRRRADSLLGNADLEVLPAKNKQAIRYRIRPRFKTVQLSMELEFRPGAGMPLESRTEQAIPAREGMPLTDAWKVLQIITATRFTNKPEGPIQAFYNSRKDLLSYCQQQYSQYNTQIQ